MKRKAFSSIKPGGKLPPVGRPLGIGDKCRLNTGGPEMLVVDFCPHSVTVAWYPIIDKHRISRFPTEATVLRSVVTRI